MATRELSTGNLSALHALLTDDHGLAELAQSTHFLPAHQRGKPREYEEVNLGASGLLAAVPPRDRLRGTSFEAILATARALGPFEAALYLITRIPYLQVFANGNKRSSRAAANAALLGQGQQPLSFADVDKRDYIRGMAAFYELGHLHTIERTFIEGYARSAVRSGELPASQRGPGLDMGQTAQALVDYVTTGRRPAALPAALFISG